MDKVIVKKKGLTRDIVIGGIVVTFVLLSLYLSLSSDGRSNVNIDKTRIIIDKVSIGDFQEYIPIVGIIEPKNQRYIDASQLGVIKAIHKKSGDSVIKGEVLLELTNAELELNVMNQRAYLHEQQSILRNTQLRADQNSISLKANLAKTNAQFRIREHRYFSVKKLFKTKQISEFKFEEAESEYVLYKELQEIYEDNLELDKISRETYKKEIKKSLESVKDSLSALQRVLDTLKVKASIDGRFTSGDLQIGQSIASGTRIGQIYELNNYKIRVEIDELFHPRISNGQRGTFKFKGKSNSLEIYNIHPNINAGVFISDLNFSNGNTPIGMKEGQRVQIKLELDSPQSVVRLPSGGFYSNTGGHWIYAINDNETEAVKIPIKLGRKNPQYYEVLEGLKPGMKVITSTYSSFGESERLIL